MRTMGQIPEIQKNIRMTTIFSGYDHNEVIADGEMYHTENLSDDRYPLMATRKKRGIIEYSEARISETDTDGLNGIHGRDKLVYIIGEKVYYDGDRVNGISVSADESMLPKKIVSMGAYTLIWPDKVYFNTVDPTDCGGIGQENTKTGTSVTLQMCRMDGTDYDMTQISVGTTPPASPANGKLWIDQSGDVDVLRQYYSPTNEWMEVASVYVKIGATGIGTGLSEYDSVMISGLEAPGSETSQRVKDQIEELNGSYTVMTAGQDYIVITGLISKTMSALKNNTVTISREAPDLDYICESNNRLWGCKYGMENGQVVNEIRASKLGDFRNWSSFMGISTDSYTVSIGTDGPFTGCVAQRGYPVFFKENCIHKISGMTPSTFQVSTTNCRGVQDGSWRSVAIVNETVYYKSRKDVMAYDGNMPVSISDQLGNVMYSDARAGAKGDKYYISMKDTDDHWSLFTYNTKYQIWYREDSTKILGFGTVSDELYMIDERNNRMLTAAGSEGTKEDDLEWSAEFGLSGVELSGNEYGGTSRSDVNGSHYLSRFDIRMQLEEKAKAELEIQYDSSGVWTRQGEIHGNRMKTFTLPVIPKRCDHLRFRLKGKGGIKVYSIARYMEVGTDAGEN